MTCPAMSPARTLHATTKGSKRSRKEKSYWKTSYTCNILKTCTEKELYSMRGLEDGFNNGYLSVIFDCCISFCMRHQEEASVTPDLLPSAGNCAAWLHLPVWRVGEAHQVMWKQRVNWEERNIREVLVNIYSLSTQNECMHHRPHKHVGIQPVSLQQQLKCIN